MGLTEVKNKKRKAGKFGGDAKMHKNDKPPVKKMKLKKEAHDNDNQPSNGLTSIKLNKKAKTSIKKEKEKFVKIEGKTKKVLNDESEVNNESTQNGADQILTKKKVKNAERRKEIRKEFGQYKPENVDLNEEELKKRIEKISCREGLSKTARRKLAVFKKKLQILQGTYVQKPPTVPSSLTQNEKRKLRRKLLLEKTRKMLENEDGVEKDDENMDIAEKAATAAKAVKGFKAKRQENLKNKEKHEKKENIKSKGIKVKTENIKVEFEENGHNEESDEENEESDEDSEEDDEDEDNNKVFQKNISKNAKKVGNEVKLNKAAPKALLDKQNVQKKSRYVLFVGNLPYTATSDDIKKHFLTKVNEVASVRIPLDRSTQKPRGMAYVEFNNSVDYEKGLSLHHSQITGRRINVLYSESGSKTVSKRPNVVAKNKKLHALRKQGKLAGSVKETQKRSVRRNKQKNKSG